MPHYACITVSTPMGVVISIVVNYCPDQSTIYFHVTKFNTIILN